MLIAQQKRKENLAEYILYLWQVEDMIRAQNFSMEKIRKNIIEPFGLPPDIHRKTEEWYNQLVHLMKNEKIENTGHCRFLINLVNDLHQLHLELLDRPEETTYRHLYRQAEPHIRALEEKSQHRYMHETDTCLHGLYGLLLLKLQKRTIHPETQDAFQHIGKMIAYLAARYKAREEKGKQE